jgi:hypothetical protein
MTFCIYFPYSEEATFDMTYYTTKHLPMVKSLMPGVDFQIKREKNITIFW